MLKQSDVVRLARGATRRVMTKQVGLFAPKARELARLEELKALRAKKPRRSAGLRHLIEA